MSITIRYEKTINNCYECPYCQKWWRMFCDYDVKNNRVLDAPEKGIRKDCPFLPKYKVISHDGWEDGHFAPNPYITKGIYNTEEEAEKAVMELKTKNRFLDYEIVKVIK